MKRLLILLLCAFFLLSANISACAQQIRVGVVTGQRTVLVKAVNGIATVKDASGGNVLELTAGASTTIIAQNGALKINGVEKTASSLSVIPGEGALLEVNRHVYRGSFRINIASGGTFLYATNLLSVEEYLYGTVSDEVLALWPEEAFKAQVIVNRTNAMQAVRSPANSYYDIPAMGIQYYYGVEKEREDIKAVVDSTAGYVATWQGGLVKLPFFPSSGGRTETGGQPYLKSVLDHDQDSPDFEWQKMFTAKEIGDSLRYAGYEEYGTLRGFDFSPLDIAKLTTSSDRGLSGRLKTVRIIFDRGFAVIEGEKFANIVGLPSSSFDIAIDNVLPQEVEVPITDNYGNVIGVKKIPVEVNRPTPFLLNRPNVQRITWADNEKIIIKGRGRGAGIGYSQWGARSLAQSGSSFSGIIRYYFPGVQIQKIY